MILVDENLALSRIDIDDGRVTCIKCGDGSIITTNGSCATLISENSSDTSPTKRILYKNILFLYNDKFRCNICADIDTDIVEELYNKYKFFVIPEKLKETFNLDNYEYRKSPSTNRTLFLVEDSDSYIEKDKDSDNGFELKCSYGELGSISVDRDERKYTAFVLSPTDTCSHISTTCLFNVHTRSYIPFVYDWCGDKMYRDGNVMVDVDDDSDCSSDNNTQNNTKKDEIIIPPSPMNKLRDLLSNVMYFDKDHNITIIPGDDSICFANTNKHFTFLMCSGENQYDSDGYMINISNAISFNMRLSYVGYKQFFDIITDNNGKCRVGMPVPKTIYMTYIDGVFIVDNKPYTNVCGEELKYEPLHIVDDKEDK